MTDTTLENETQSTEAENPDLLGVGDAGQTDQPAETTDGAESKADRLYAGKYKTIEELEKGYENAQAKIREKTGAPDEYDFNTAFDIAGIELDDSDDGKARLEGFEKEVRDLNLNQEQLEFGMKLASQWVQDQLAQMGPAVDVKQEQAALEKMWGDETSERLNQLRTWARKELDAEILNKPLSQTAKGIEFLHRMMTERSEPNPLANNESGVNAEEQEDLRGKLQAIMDDPDYFTNTAKGRALQARADSYAKRIKK